MIRNTGSHRAINTLVVLVTLIVSLLLMATYARNVLHGNIDFHFLPAKLFGIPENLAERGIQPLYVGEKETGWDGQFYYYIANDLLGVKDTPMHIDAPSYRYQRIGLSALTALVGVATGQDWVSPTTFYITYLALILVATFCAARLFSEIGIYPSLALLWSLGIGTQLTLLNALPDAAADAFLIIAITSLYFRQHLIALLAFTLSALSREAYVLFPAIIAAFQLFKCIQQHPTKNAADAIWQWLRTLEPWTLTFPVILFGAWQIYIRFHFGIAPSAQAHEILGQPFAAWYAGLSTGLQGHHFLVAPGRPSYFEGFSQIAFMALLIITIITAIRVLIFNLSRAPFPLPGIALASLAFCAIYICFGRTVAMHYTGYMKAATLFFFIIPLLINAAKIKLWLRRIILLLLVVIVVFTDIVFWKDRIDIPGAGDYARYTHTDKVFASAPIIPCLDHYDASVEIRGLEDTQSNTLLNRLIGSREMVLWIDVTNNSGQRFIATNGKGSVNMSYHILADNGKAVVQDGIRTMLPDGLAPSETARAAIVVPLPRKPGRYILRVTPVQEGCAWFYMVNPSSAKDLLLELK